MLIRNAPYKYRVNYNQLGLTGDQVKEYFDVSAYRNVLDMLNTFDGVLKLWGNDLFNNSRLISANSGMIGYAIPLIGVIGKSGRNSPRYLVIKRLINNGLGFGLTYPPKLGAFNVPIFPAIRATRPNIVFDLLGLARNINWELNRLRLPVPHNFRQIADKIQGRDYNNMGVALTDTTKYINLVELIDVYGQLKLAINTLRVSTRKEIDAASLAKKVQEETIRREQEKLISRQQAEKLAEENRLRILAEKKAALEKEFLEAEALKQKLADTRAQLAVELQALESSKQVASEPEIIDIDIKQNQVIDAIEKVEIVAIDKDVALETAKKAAINVNNELLEIQQEQVEIANIILDDLEQKKTVSLPEEIKAIEQQQAKIIKETEIFTPVYIPPSNVNIKLPENKQLLAPSTEKSNILPILATIAAGVLLT